MDASTHENKVNLISRGLYMIVNQELGSEEIVRQRREKHAIVDGMYSCVGSLILNTSGSKAEGLDMKSSDIDWMFWDRDISFVETYTQLIAMQNKSDIILVMDTSIASPGFTLLKIGKIDQIFPIISYALVDMFNDRYLSSMKYKHFFHQKSSYELHGPCLSGRIGELFQFDYAYCLHSPFWPSQARQCIKRLYECGWPSRKTIKTIVDNGFNAVPIASKIYRFREAADMEWRLSFSLAEKSLIHAMNHPQFLCYGLLKIFLNEVLKKIEGIEDLICSYFLKTAMFWEVTESRSDHTNNNILHMFWNCFRRIISWVSIGYCPNFFIPENNMFSDKIYGQNQEKLLHYLYTFYKEGYFCLLRCTSIRDVFSVIVQHPLSSFHILNANEQQICRAIFVFENMNIVLQSCEISALIFDESDIFTTVNRLLQIRATSLVAENAIELGFRQCMQILAEHILLFIQTQQPNIQGYNRKTESMCVKATFKLLQSQITTVGSSDIICSKILYSFKSHRKSLRKALSVKQKLQQSGIIYSWILNFNLFVRYNGLNMSYIEFINKHVVVEYSTTENSCLVELKLEASVARENGRPVNIPPLVMINFLLVLNYHALNDTIRRDDVVREMEALLSCDDGTHVHFLYRPISLEILGICHQTCNNFPRAYHFYLMALNDEWSWLKQATLIRILSLVYAIYYTS